MGEHISRMVEQKIEEWSSDGKRVILLARKILAHDHTYANPSAQNYEAHMLHEAKDGLTLVGLVGLIDSPRAEIHEVISILRGAQIRVFMASAIRELMIYAPANSFTGNRRFRQDSFGDCASVWYCDK